MKNTNQLGTNIRSLRKAYGETQEQLGEIVYVEKNAISNYENGKREPNKKTLSAIAKHYMVSVEELLHEDLSNLDRITIDKDSFWKYIYFILPIVSSEKAAENPSFQKAHQVHEILYEESSHISLDWISKMGICFGNYLKAIQDAEIEAESAANIVALWFLLMVYTQMVPDLIKNKSAVLSQIISTDEKLRKTLTDPDSSFFWDAKEHHMDTSENEMDDLIFEMLTVIKKSRNWSDLADYYLALRYVWNLVDNDLECGFNRRIGVEMMYTFVSVENMYALRFLENDYDSLLE